MFEDIDKEDIKKDINKFLDNKEKEIKKTSMQNSIKSYKIGRNEPCPCGSGKKYKKCCANVTPDKDYNYYMKKLKPFVLNANYSDDISESELNNYYELVKKADQDYPVDHKFSKIAGNIAYKLGYFDEAANYLKKHYRIVKNDISEDIVVTLIESLHNRNQYKDAEKILSELIDKPASITLLFLMAQTKFELGKIQEGYKLGINCYKKAEKDIYVLNTLLKIFIEHKLYNKAFKLISENFYRFNEIEFNQDNMKFWVKSLVKSVFLLDSSKDLADKQILDYFKKISEVINYINPNKKLNKKEIRKLNNILSKQYDLSFLLVRLFYTIEDYEWIVNNEKILLENTDDGDIIFDSIIDANFQLENYEYIVKELKNVFEYNLLHSSDYFSTYNQMKFYLYSLYETKDKKNTKNLLKFLGNAVKKDVLQIILVILANENDYKAFKIIEFLHNIDDINIFDQEEILEVQLSLLNKDFKYLWYNKIDEEKKETLNNLLKKYKKINDNSFIYHYTNWLLNKIEKNDYKLDLDTIINKNCNHVLSAELKYLVILKLKDPQIIIDNPPETNLLKKKDIDIYKSIAKVKLGDITNLKNLIENHPENDYEYIINIINKVLNPTQKKKIF